MNLEKSFKFILDIMSCSETFVKIVTQYVHLKKKLVSAPLLLKYVTNPY